MGCNDHFEPLFRISAATACTRTSFLFLSPEGFVYYYYRCFLFSLYRRRRTSAGIRLHWRARQIRRIFKDAGPMRASCPLVIRRVFTRVLTRRRRVHTRRRAPPQSDHTRAALFARPSKTACDIVFLKTKKSRRFLFLFLPVIYSTREISHVVPRVQKADFGGDGGSQLSRINKRKPARSPLGFFGARRRQNFVSAPNERS